MFAWHTKRRGRKNSHVLNKKVRVKQGIVFGGYPLISPFSCVPVLPLEKYTIINNLSRFSSTGFFTFNVK